MCRDSSTTKRLVTSASVVLIISALCWMFTTPASIVITRQEIVEVPCNSSHRENELRERYLTTIVRSITGYAIKTPGTILTPRVFAPKARELGADWPEFGVTMVGILRSQWLWRGLDTVLTNGIEGDFVETGTWRGGSSILARAVINTHPAGENGRLVWVCDSFEGLPKATTNKDDDSWSKMTFLSVSLEEVRDNFAMFDVLNDTQLRFVKGFFQQTMPLLKTNAELKHIAFLRMDGDMYESTTDVLYNLWNKVSVGGVILVDDWTIHFCRHAIEDFFAAHARTRPDCKMIDTMSCYFIKTEAFPVSDAIYATFMSTRKSGDKPGS